MVWLDKQTEKQKLYTIYSNRLYTVTFVDFLNDVRVDVTQVKREGRISLAAQAHPANRIVCSGEI